MGYIIIVFRKLAEFIKPSKDKAFGMEDFSKCLAPLTQTH
jgi:hypothetical protein